MKNFITATPSITEKDGKIYASVEIGPLPNTEMGAILCQLLTWHLENFMRKAGIPTSKTNPTEH